MESELRFLERCDKDAGWAQLVVIGPVRWASIRFRMGEIGGWKHVATRIELNVDDWPDMDGDEIIAWMRAHWTPADDALPKTDLHAIAKKYASEVMS